MEAKIKKVFGSVHKGGGRFKVFVSVQCPYCDQVSTTFVWTPKFGCTKFECACGQKLEVK